MDTQPGFVTATELKVIGYEIEEYGIDVETEGHTDTYLRYRVTAPGGQIINENSQTPTEAWDYARWHFRKTN